MERRDSLVCIAAVFLMLIARITSFISVGTSILLLQFVLAVSETLIRVGEASGNVEKSRATKRFLCTYCRCIFRADKGDYITRMKRFDRFYECICPNCRRKTTYVLEPKK